MASMLSATLTTVTSTFNQTRNQSGEPSSAPPVPTDLASLWTFLLSFSALRDWAKLFILGGVLEAIRRLLNKLWTYFMDTCFLTAEFEENDESYLWMMTWLSKQPRWGKARTLQVSTRRFGQTGVADVLPGEEEHSNQKKRLNYIPSYNNTQYLWFKGSWIQVTRTVKTSNDPYGRWDDERLSISMFTRSHHALDALLLEAKRVFKAETEDRINIFVADQYNDWSLATSRPKRPLSSVVLDAGIKERFLYDAKDFMASEKWYADRGIPWRRGYLLYGAPGSGKSSLIHALAGELGLNIYVVSLSKRGLDDTSLGTLISQLPAKSLALMEDIDAAFHRGVSREPEPTNKPPGPPGARDSPAQGVTLSGLLNAIDGVTAQEGRLLFATTNQYSALDPALTRPGRLDVHVEFELAGRWQAEELFRCFYPPSVPEPKFDAETDSPLILLDDEKLAVDVDEKVAKTTPTAQCGSLSTFSDDREPCPPLTPSEVSRLAKSFAERIPEREFSMAAIQGLLMQYKTRPHLAIEETGDWVERERKHRREKEAKKAEEESRAVAQKVPDGTKTPPTTDERATTVP